MGTRFRISRCVVEIIQREAAKAAPREACGLLFGSENEIAACEVAENVAENPERHFEIDPRALFAALKAERAGGPKLVGYWHSHPSGNAMPSATDHEMAAADGKLWLIVSGEDLTLWRAVEHQIFSWDSDAARATGRAKFERAVTGFQRVAIATGNIRHILPCDNSDVDLIPLLAEAGYPAIAPYLDDLVAWTFDCNWPIAVPMGTFLAGLGEPVAAPIQRVLRGADSDDKWGCLACMGEQLRPEVREALRGDLEDLTERPSEADCRAKVDLLAREILAAWASGA